jgi:hypothetical protein
MRTTLIALILLALVAPAFGQGNKGTSAQQMANREKMEKTQVILRDLAQFDYKAKMDVPVSDTLFVSNGKLMEAMYNSAMKSGKVAVKAGQVAKISQVELLDFAVAVSFADGSVTLIGTPAATINTSTAPVADLIALGKASIAAYFDAVKK